MGDSDLVREIIYDPEETRHITEAELAMQIGMGDFGKNLKPTTCGANIMLKGIMREALTPFDNKEDAIAEIKDPNSRFYAEQQAESMRPLIEMFLAELKYGPKFDVDEEIEMVTAMFKRLEIKNADTFIEVLRKALED